MTPLQRRRAEKLFMTLSDAGASRTTRALEEAIVGHLHPPAGSPPNLVFDPALDDALVHAERVLAELRVVSPGQERRQTPRYPFDPPLPALLNHRDLDHRAECYVADVGLGGARLIAPATTRSTFRWADQVKIVLRRSDGPPPFVGWDRAEMDGEVVRISVDLTGVVFNTCFDRTEGDWSAIDRWVRTLAIRALEHPPTE